MPSVAYNSSDPTQQAFLSALAQGEAGKYGYSGGVGNTDLSTVSSADQYGFPQWGGFGNSHAAGEYQFQPATWDAVASQHGLNFSNPADQNAAAWYYAQDTYANKTGGSLTDALAKGDYTGVQAALASVWPSVTGNGATPGLAKSLSAGTGAPISGANPISADTAGFDPLHPIQSLSNVVTSEFVRIGLFVIGGLIILVALWKLLSETGVVPAPEKVAATVAKVAAVA